MGRACRDDLPDGESGIFLREGLDRKFSDLPVGPISRHARPVRDEIAAMSARPGSPARPSTGGAVNAAEYRSPYRKNASISDISEILQHIGAYLPAPTRNGYLPDCYWHVLASISVRTRARRVLGPLFAK
jgi:hypothetical protein